MKIGTHMLGALAVALAAAGSPAFADDHRGDSDRRDSHRGDSDRSESLSELTAQWWQWALSIPAAVNPLTDTTGEFCMVGQRGDIWFLAGSTTGQPASRTCAVPEGVPLFFPVLNTVWINTPVCDGFALTVAELRALTAAAMDGATGLSVTLDGRPIRNLRRVRSEVFHTVFPKGNLFGLDDCLFGTPQSPAVDDGYYVKLRGLSEGQHHLSIRGTNAGGFLVDVFYTLNVVKVVTKDRH